MKLAELIKTKANRVLGIDASTNSVAFCLMEGDKPLKWGKIISQIVKTYIFFLLLKGLANRATVVAQAVEQLHSV